MTRPIAFGTAAIVLFVLGVLAANTRIAQGIIPVTAYEADVNKDTRVNIADVGLVASKYGHVVPTATPVSIATPPRSKTYWVTTQVGLPGCCLPSDSAVSALCDLGDVVTGGGWYGTPDAPVNGIVESYPTVDEAGTEGWAARLRLNGSGEVRAVCIDNAPFHIGSSTTP